MSVRQSLCNRLSAIGLRQDRVHSLVDTTMKWVSNSGTEWTISRFKELKLWYIHQLAGEDYTFSQWIKTDRSGRPKGPWGSLPMGSERDIARTLNALNVYTSFVANSATKQQEEKFLGSAMTKDTDTPIPIGPTRYPARDSHPRSKKRKLPSPKPWSDHVWGKTKAPLSDGTSVPEDQVDSWLPDNGEVLASIGLRLRDYRSDLVSAKIASFVRERGYRESTGGKIAYIQEPGFKLRAIGNPYRIWQVLTDPLKQSVMGRLATIPEDCTYDQAKGIQKVQQWLQDGRRVHSVDLSDATNLFPLSAQLQVLTQMYDTSDQATNNQLDYFVRASRGRWTLPSGESMRWTRGQPLGLGPSFGVFALSHNIVMMSLRRQGLKGDYVILGDDIAIVGDDLASAYKQTMTKSLGCKISESKTLSSNTCAEFAGKVITPEGVIPTFKWRDVSDRSFIDVVRSLGPTSKGLLKRRQRHIIDAISMVPEEFGGLGWNPKGIPYEVRASYGVYLGLMDDPTEDLTVRSSSSTHRQILNKIMYEREEAFPIMASDREATLSPTRTEFERLMALLGVNDTIVDPMLVGGDLRVSAPKGDPRGPSTLEVMESKLRHARKSVIPSLTSAYYQEMAPLIDVGNEWDKINKMDLESVDDEPQQTSDVRVPRGPTLSF